VVKQVPGGDPLGVALKIPVKWWDLFAEPGKRVDHQQIAFGSGAGGRAVCWKEYAFFRIFLSA